MPPQGTLRSFALTPRIVTGDSRGNVEIWDVEKRVMEESFIAHEHDVLTLSVFSYLDCMDRNTDCMPSTLIVSGGVDAKVV